jgi:hypothetical protein
MTDTSPTTEDPDGGPVELPDDAGDGVLPESDGDVVAGPDKGTDDPADGNGEQVPYDRPETSTEAIETAARFGRSDDQTRSVEGLNDAMRRAQDDEEAQEIVRQAVERGDLNADGTHVDPDVGQTIGPVADRNRAQPNLAGPAWHDKQERIRQENEERRERQDDADAEAIAGTHHIPGTEPGEGRSDNA